MVCESWQWSGAPGRQVKLLFVRSHLLGVGPHWWCPLLPDSNAQIHTVVGNAFQLPKLENPSNAEVAEYHQIYMDKLVDLYDRYKGRFGDASRPLVLH